MYLLVSPYLVYSLSDSAIKPSMTAALLFFLSTFVFLSFLWLLLLVSLFCLPLSFSRFFGCCFSSLFSVYLCLSLFSLATASVSLICPPPSISLFFYYCFSSLFFILSLSASLSCIYFPVLSSVFLSLLVFVFLSSFTSCCLSVSVHL